jgi:hypothetical protein
MIIDGTNGLTFNDSSTQTKGGLTGSTSQLCKAWVSYNATAQTISSSYNVSSVTYNATGEFTINFTTAFADNKYAIVGTTLGGVSIGTGRTGTSDITTTTAKMYTGYISGVYTANNSAYNYVAFFSA